MQTYTQHKGSLYYDKLQLALSCVHPLWHSRKKQNKKTQSKVKNKKKATTKEINEVSKISGSLTDTLTFHLLSRDD